MSTVAEIWPDLNDYNEWLSGLLAGAGDEWDRDEAAESIVTDYVCDLERRIADCIVIAEQEDRGRRTQLAEILDVLRRAAWDNQNPHSGDIGDRP